MIATMGLDAFCRALSARTPSPGGGATAAVAGAIGAAQLAMVAAYAGAEDLVPELEHAIGDLLRLADEDAEAYAAFRAAPKGDRAAKDRIVRVPREMRDTAETVLALAGRIDAPGWFAVDLQIAIGCLRVCANGAGALVEVNS